MERKADVGNSSKNIMQDSKYTIGLDYGTLSARAVLVSVQSGEVVAESIFPYPHGILRTVSGMGKELPADFAIQEIDDYVEAMYHTIQEVVTKSDCKAEDVIGIGIDATSSTFLPLSETGEPLCKTEGFRGDPHAYLKLWKHHGAQEEADRITALAKERGEKFMMRCGGKVNVEWMLPKLLEIAEKAPDVYEASDNFMEVSDYLVFLLTGEVTRCMCHAGYKLLWNEEDGYPAEDFLEALHPKLSSLREKLKGREVQVGESAGKLTEKAADRLGLQAGTTVAASMIDAHVAVPSVGIDGPDKALMILGTSCCMLLCSEKLSYIPGISGCVKNAVLPGLYAYEAGQSAVGDLFEWFINNCVPGSYEREALERDISIHTLLSEKAARLKPGESGLVALDWWNGNRSCLADAKLSGMILGLTLRTKPEEIYRALLESTAFGMRAIFEEYEKAGVTAKALYACGGIVRKNPLMMQIYADVLGKTVYAGSVDQGSAFGSAVYAAVAAGIDAGGFGSVEEAVHSMCASDICAYFSENMCTEENRGGMCASNTCAHFSENVCVRDDMGHKYEPVLQHVETYQRLYSEYKSLHDYFGTGGNEVMHRLKS